MRQPRYQHCLIILDEFIYAFGGKTNGSIVLKSCEKYSPAANKWI